MSGNGGETKSGSTTTTAVAQAVVIPQLTQQQRRALARGRTIGQLWSWSSTQPIYIKTKGYV